MINIDRIDGALSRKLTISSFVCALLVVYLHATDTFRTALCEKWYYGGIVFVRMIGEIAVPYFFLVAGYLGVERLVTKGWKNLICSRVKSLVVPYFCWVVLLGVIPFLLHYLPCFKAYPWPGVARLLGIDLRYLPDRYSALFWFVRALFVCFIVSPVLVRNLRSRFWGGWFLVVLYVLYLVFGSHWVIEDQNTLWHYGISLRGVFYFSLGMYCRIHACRIPRIPWCFDLLLGLMLAGGYASLVVVSGRSPLSSLVMAGGVPLLLMGFWRIFNFNWPIETSGLSFGIYCVHFPFIVVVSSLFTKFLGEGFMVCAGTFLMVIAMSVSTVLLLHKYAGRAVISLLFGGR